MKPLRLPFCAALFAAACGTAASLVFPRSEPAPEVLVRDFAEGMLEAAASAAPQRRRGESLSYAEHRILAHVDAAEAARLAAGAAWARASAREQAELAAAFRPMLVRSSLEALHARGGRNVAVLPAQAGGRRANDITVQSRFEGEKGSALAVEYALHRRGGEWKIYDIRVDGESLVAACRPLFEAIAQAEGVGGLIRRLKGSASPAQAVVAA